MNTRWFFKLGNHERMHMAESNSILLVLLTWEMTH